MREFNYERPQDEAQALTLNARPQTSVIAGGTELLNWMRLGIAAPNYVVDIGRLPGLNEIVKNGDALTIGSLANLNEVGGHPLVNTHARVLAEASLAAASAQLRNRATLGGNALQRTRCPYFRAEEPMPWGCNKRSAGSGCSAHTGINDEHAIFGWTDECVATHPSDPLVALCCLDAEVQLLSSDGVRTVPVRQLHVTQQEAAEAGEYPAQYETTLRPGELIVSYNIPLREGTSSSYVKVRERQSYAFALVAAAAAVRIQDDRIADIRMALGSVAQRPWRLEHAEAALIGSPANEESISAAIDEDLKQAKPLEGNGYKVVLARNTATRAVMLAVS